MPQQRKRVVGQAKTEMIILVALIGLALVVGFSFYGRTIGRAFFCAGQAIAKGNGVTFSCPGSESGGGGGQKPGETVVASGGPAPLPELGGGAASAPGGGPKQKKSGGPAGGGGGEAQPSDATLGGGPGTLPGLGGGVGSPAGGGAAATSGGGAPSVSGGVPQPSQGGVGEVDAISGAGPRVASSSQSGPVSGASSDGAAQGKSGGPTNPDVLPVLPAPRGGSAQASKDSTSEPSSAEPRVVANVPGSSSPGGGPSSGGAPQGKPGEKTDGLSGFLKPSGGPPVSAPGGASPQKLGAPVVVDNPPPIFKDDHGSGMVPLQPLKPQSFGEVNFGAPNGGGAQPGCVLCGGGPLRPDMKQMNDFMLGGTPVQRLNEAVDLLGGVAPGSIVEVKSADGSSKVFRVEHPLKWVDNDDWEVSPDRRHYQIEDDKKWVVQELTYQPDPSKRKIVVNDGQTAGEMALDWRRQEHAATDANNASADFLGDRAKEREKFVKQVVEDNATAAYFDIESKKELERKGATIGTKLPYESEYDRAFNKAFNDEFSKSGSFKAARDAGRQAQLQAVRDAVKKDLADRAGKIFDQRYEEFAKKNADGIKKAEAERIQAAKQAAEHDKRKRMEDAIALVLARASATNYMCRTTACNKDSDEAIQLIEAYVAVFGTDTADGGPNGFIHQNADALKKLLGPYGFRFVDGPGYGMNPIEWQKEVLYISLENSRKETDARERRDLRLGIRPPGFEDVEDYHNQFWRSTAAPPDEEYYKDNQLVAAEVDGQYFQGTRAQYHYEKTIGHALRQLHQIAEAGPASLIGRFFGEKGAEIGAAIDNGLIAAAGIRGGRGGWYEGGAEYRPGPAPQRQVGPVERAPVREPIPEPDLPGAPRAQPQSPPGQAPQPPKPAVQVASANGAAGPAPAPPNPPQQQQQQQQNNSRSGQADDIRQRDTGEMGAGGDSRAMDPDRVLKRQQQQAADAQRAQRAQQEAARQARDAQRQRDLARRVADANATLDRQAKNLPRDNENISADEAIRRAENGDFSIVISMNGRRHREAYEEKILSEQLKGDEPVDVSKAPPPRNVFVDGKQVRINFEALTDAQKARVQALATRTSGGGGGGGGGGTVDPRADTRPQVDPGANTQPRVDPRANTQPQGQAPLDKTQVGHAPGPQSPGNTQIGHAPGPLPGNSGNTGNPPAQNRPAQQTVKGNNTAGPGSGGEPPKPPPPAGGGQPPKTGPGAGNESTLPAPPSKPGSTSGGQNTAKLEPPTVRGQGAGRDQQKTGEITRPGASDGGVGERTGKFPQPAPGVNAARADPGPGKFAPDDLAFGISRPDGKTDVLAKFAGQAKDGGKIQITEKTRRPAEGTPERVVNAAVAKETIVEAKVYLKASGGQLRFSLEGFNVNDALNPKSANFNKVTSHEFRAVLRDPFFRGRVRFYDPARRSPGNPHGDVTDEILKRQVPQ